MLYRIHRGSLRMDDVYVSAPCALPSHHLSASSWADSLHAVGCNGVACIADGACDYHHDKHHQAVVAAFRTRLDGSDVRSGRVVGQVSEEAPSASRIETASSRVVKHESFHYFVSDIQ